MPLGLGSLRMMPSKDPPTTHQSAALERQRTAHTGIVDQRVNVTIIALDILEGVLDRRIVLNVDLDGDDI